MVAALHQGTVHLLNASEKIKHSTTAVEHVCKIVQDTFVLLNVQAKSAQIMNTQLTGLVQLIDAVQWIFPINHFFLSDGYQTTSKEMNVFWGAHLFVSGVDFCNFITKSGASNLAQHAAEIGRRFPVLQCLKNIPLTPVVNVSVIVMFSAYAKDSWDKLWSLDPNLQEVDKKAALCNLVYSIGVVAIVVIGMVSVHSTAPLSIAVHAVGLVGSVYKAYNP